MKPFKFTNYQEYLSLLDAPTPTKDKLERYSRLQGYVLILLHEALEIPNALKSRNTDRAIEGITLSIKTMSLYIEETITAEVAKKALMDQIQEILWIPQYSITLPDYEIQLYGRYVEEFYIKCVDQLIQGKGTLPSNHTLMAREILPKMIKSLHSICLNLSHPLLQLLNDDLPEA